MSDTTDSIVNITNETERTDATSYFAMETATKEKGIVGAFDQQITSIAPDTTTQEVITNRPTGQQAPLELIVG